MTTLKELIQSEVTHGEFTLCCGKTSPVMLDLSRVLRTRKGRDHLSDAIWNRHLLPPDIGLSIGGMLSGADLVCASLHHGRYFAIRKEAKGRGYDQGRITGNLSPSDKVVLVDDVCTSGGSIKEAYDVVTAFGCDVVAAFCVVERPPFGGMDVLRELGIPCTSLFMMDEDGVVK